MGPSLSLANKSKVTDKRGSLDQSGDNQSDREDSNAQPNQIFRRKARGKLDQRLVLSSQNRKADMVEDEDSK